MDHKLISSCLFACVLFTWRTGCCEPVRYVEMPRGRVVAVVQGRDGVTASLVPVEGGSVADSKAEAVVGLKAAKIGRVVGLSGGAGVMLSRVSDAAEVSYVARYDSVLNLVYESRIPLECSYRVANDLQCWYLDSPASGYGAKLYSVADGSARFDYSGQDSGFSSSATWAYIGDSESIVFDKGGESDSEVTLYDLREGRARWKANLQDGGWVEWSGNSIRAADGVLYLAVRVGWRTLTLYAMEHGTGRVLGMYTSETIGAPVVLAAQGQRTVALLSGEDVTFLEAGSLRFVDAYSTDGKYVPSGPQLIQHQDGQSLYRIVGEYQVFQRTGVGGDVRWGACEVDLERHKIVNILDYSDVSVFNSGGAVYGAMQ